MERKARRITVHALERTGLDAAAGAFEVAVHCSKGTYVRTLVAEIGEAIGCGAHVTALRRTGLGPFTGLPMVTLEALEEAATSGPEALDALLLPTEAALADWPTVTLDPDSARFLRHGQAVFVPRAPARGPLRLFGPDGFLGVGDLLDDGRVAPRRLMVGTD